MDNLVAKLLELFVVGNRKVLLRLMFLLVVVLIIGPIILNYFYGNLRLEQQVRILRELSEIDPVSIHDYRLKIAYDKMIDALSQTKPASTAVLTAQFTVTSFSSIFSGSNLWKFLSGATLSVLLVIAVFFSKFDNFGERSAAFFIFAFIAFTFGIIGALIPTFSPIMINIVGFPFIQLCFVIYLSVISSRASKKNAKKT